MDNLYFIPNNILTKIFKELIKYKDDYQQQAKMAKKKKKQQHQLLAILH